MNVLMMRRRGAVGASVLAGLVCGKVVWGQSEFRGLGTPAGVESNAGGMSADGQIVFGTIQRNRLFRWTPGGGMVDLGTPSTDAANISSGATAVSANGSIAAFSWVSVSTNHFVGYRWRAGVGFEPLPLPPGALRGAASMMSDDGQTYVVRIQYPNAGQNGVATWGGPVLEVPVPPDPPGLHDGYIYGMTGDASQVVVSYGTPVDYVGAGAIWTPSDGSVTFFPSTPPSDARLGTGNIWGTLSRDGSTLLGYYQTTTTHDVRGVNRLLHWRRPGQILVLSELPLETRDYVSCLTPDARVLIGYRQPGLNPNQPWIWTEGSGIVNLTDYLTATGADLTGWSQLSASAVSNDGLTFCGDGMHNGIREAFWGRLANLPPGTHCAADMNYDGVVTSADFFTFLRFFFLNAADFDGSGETNSNDFFAFLTAFFQGCP